jgi:hypothetical protein
MRASLFLAALAFTIAPVSSSAQDAPDFSGKWKLDTARSVGPVNPPPSEVSGRSARTEPPSRSQRTGMAGGSRQPAAGGAAPLPAAAQQHRPETIKQELAIRMDGTRFRIEQVTNGRKETFQLALDGAESKNKYYIGREAVELPTTTHWEGRKLVTSSSTMASTSRGRIPVVFSETRYLSEDGSELIVESSLQSTAGSFERKLVYVKM